MPYLLTAVLLLGICLAGLFPFFKKKAPALPVLYYGPLTRADGKEILPPKTLQKQLEFLRRKGFTPVLPGELITRGGKVTSRFKKPVLLVFEGGYRSFYTHAWPVLNKYGVKACVGAPTDYIGEYDAWNPSPWQNLMTQEEWKEILQSGKVEMLSQGLTHERPRDWPETDFLERAQEAAYRLQTRFKQSAFVYLFTDRPSAHLAEQLITRGYRFSVSRQSGNNPLPARAAQPLKAFPMKRNTFLPSLAFKMTRP